MVSNDIYPENMDLLNEIVLKTFFNDSDVPPCSIKKCNL